MQSSLWKRSIVEVVKIQVKKTRSAQCVHALWERSYTELPLPTRTLTARARTKNAFGNISVGMRCIAINETTSAQYYSTFIQSW